MQPLDNDLINLQSNKADSLSTKRRHHLGHFLKEVAWYFIPLTVIASTVLYITLAFVWHVNPPVIPVEGQSMRPILQTGDLVLLHGVSPSALKKGDIIAEAVPLADQQKYQLPGEVVHRIISIADTRQGGYIFQTKGDANGGPDVFQTPATDVIGLMTGKITGLGYPILFLKSRQGEIFVGAVLFVTIAYLLLGWAQRRQEQDPAIEILEMLLAETSALSTGVDSLIAKEQPAGQNNVERHNDPEQWDNSDDHDEHIMSDEVSSTSPSINEPLTELASALTTSVEMGSTTNQSVRELLDAMREYAQHLRSHTAAVQGMSQASMDLASITSDIRQLLVGVSGNTAKLSIQLSQSAELGGRQVQAQPELQDTQLEIVPAAEAAQDNVESGTDELAAQDNVESGTDELAAQDSVESGTDELAAQDNVESGTDELIHVSMELDLHGIQTKFRKATKSESEHLVYSPTFCYIAWAASSALHLAFTNKDSLNSGDRSLNHSILEVEGPSNCEETHRVVISDSERLSPDSLLSQLNSKPESSDSCPPGSALRIVDWTQSNLLTVTPSEETNDHLITVNVGGIRRCVTVITGEFGSEEFVIHPIAVITVSLSRSRNTSGLQNFLDVLRRLVE